MQPPAPQPEHLWLQQLLGEWTFELEANMCSDQPSEKQTGTNSVRALGDLWILCEGRGAMPDSGVFTNIITLGYDPAKQRFVGTFIGSVMSHLWVYDGALDANRKVLTLDTEGPSFTDEGKLTRYQDIFEIHDQDHHVLKSQTLQDDGTWMQFMTAHYYRVK